jgi:hypothetical protein
MSPEQQIVIQFLHKEKVHSTQIHRDFQHSMALKPTVFEASNIGVNSSTAGAKTCAMIRGPEDPRLIILMPKLLHTWRGNHSLRRIRWPRPWTRRQQPSWVFTQFAGNEKFSSPLGPTPVDRRPVTDESRTMRWASSRAGGYAANPFSPHYHRRWELILLQIPAHLTMIGLSRWSASKGAPGYRHRWVYARSYLGRQRLPPARFDATRVHI